VIGFGRDGDEFVAEVAESEAQVLALVVAQVAGLIEHDRIMRDPAADRAAQEAGAGAGPSDVAAELLAGLGGPTPRPPDDPVLARLFPDGYRDDPEAAAELRRLIEGDLRTQKLENVECLLATLPLDGGEIRLDAEEAEAWLLALNDARLVVGTRLGVTDETDLLDEIDDAVLRDPTGPRVFALSIYQLLGYLQETLVDALAG
jgi:Domain of unknown function (DUF2017)